MRLIGQRTTADEWNWQRVPRIGLVTAGTERRWSPISLVFGVLVVVVLSWGLFNYLGLESEKELLQVRRNSLAAVEGQVAGINDEIAGLFEQIDALMPRKEALSAGSGTEADAQVPIVWETAIEALLGLDDPDVRVETVSTSPSGDVTVVGTTRDVGSMGRLQAQLGQVSDVVEVIGFQWNETDGVITYTARLRVLR